MASPHNRRQNHLLAALPEEDQIRLFPQMELVPMPLGFVLNESVNCLQYIYFPTNCIVSLSQAKDGATSAEIAVVGHEGMVGIDLLIGGKPFSGRTVVQKAGYAYRIASQALKQECDRVGPVQSLFMRYIQALSMQMAQTSGYNRHHTVSATVSLAHLKPA